VLGGKYNRGLVIVQNTRDLCEQLNLDFTQLADQAIVLGWCIEILQACFLVSDDVMDKSITRRGKPCWYRLPEVQLDAVNDALILESFIYFLLQERFEKHPNYNQFVSMFHEVSLKTQMGQMLDLLSQPQGRKGPEVLGAFSTDLHRLIVEFKTAYYTFYIPIASSMVLCGMDSAEALEIAQRISVQLGIKFQIQDDYLDLYGDPNHIGKIGTDLQDHKCSWLLVKALERATSEQRKIVEKNLGRDEPECLATMRQLYDNLGLPQLYSEQEEASYQDIVGLIQKHADRVPPVVFTTALARIHNRSK
jgi:farnesyl diphosphate synthase